MRPVRHVLVLALALLATGCAERGLQQLYVPLGVGSGYGYSDRPAGEQRFVVTYDAPIRSAFNFGGAHGQRAADGELARAYDFALMRASEISLSNGAPAFRVSERTNDVDVRNYHGYRSPFWRPYGLRPWGYYPHGPYGWPYGPYDDSYATLTARVTLNIVLLPTLEPGAFDAQNMLATIRARYATPEA